MGESLAVLNRVSAPHHVKISLLNESDKPLPGVVSASSTKPLTLVTKSKKSHHMHDGTYGKKKNLHRILHLLKGDPVEAGDMCNS